MNRVMVRGEDGTLFCYEDDVFDEDVSDVIAEAEESYPCGSIWVEDQSRD